MYANSITPIYAGKSVVGIVDQGIFRKTIRGSVHMLKRPPALAFDVGSLKQAWKVGARRVEVKDSETGKIYYADIARIWERGRRLNRGFGEQIALCLEEWSSQAHEQLQLPMFGGDVC